MTETLYHPTTPSWPLDARNSPRVHEAFENLSHAVFADGALPERTRS
jgi:hypothetical protein